MHASLCTSICHSTPRHAPDRAGLRKLAQVPAVDININFGFNRSTLLAGVFDPQEIAEEAQRLTGELSRLKSFDPKLAPQMLRLSDLYSALQQEPAALGGYATVASGLEPSIAKLPATAASVPTLLLYCKALVGVQRPDVAEKSIRQAVKLAPQSSEAWDTLGDVLSQRAMGIMTDRVNSSPDKAKTTGKGSNREPNGGKETDKERTPQKAAENFKKLKNQKEVLARIGALLDEADRSYDRAVQVAPQSPQPYLKRGIYHGFGSKFARTLYDEARKGEDPGPTMQATLQAMIPNSTTPEVLNDYAAAARLSGSSYPMVAWYLCGEILHYQLEHPQTGETQNVVTADKLRSEARTTFARELQHLITLSQSGQRPVQIGASVALATVYFMAGQSAEAEKLAHHLTEIAPERGRPYQILSAQFAQSRRFDAMADLFQSRIKRHDSPEDRLILARIYANLNRWDAVDTQVQAALKLQPKSFRALTAQAGALIHKGDEASLKQAQKILDTNRPRLNKEALAPTSVLAFLLNQGLYFALKNQPKETKEAKQIFQQLVDHDNIPEAAAALKLMD